MQMTEDDVLKIAELASLELTSDEVRMFTDQLVSIVSYVEKLGELDTGGIPPMMHVATGVGDGSSQRDDEVMSSLSQEAALNNAPDPVGGFFCVPKVID